MSLVSENFYDRPQNSVSHSVNVKVQPGLTTPEAAVRVFGQAASSSAEEAGATIRFTSTTLADANLSSDVKERIQSVVNARLNSILGRVQEGGQRDAIKSMIQDIWARTTKVKVYEHGIELKVGKGETSFKILYDHSQKDMISLIFHHSLISGLGQGGFKTVTRALQLTRESDEELIATKEKEGVSTDREQKALSRCRDRELYGTPKTYEVSYYEGKEGVVKQRILQKLYLGGDLMEREIPANQRLRVAQELCRIVAELHEKGNISHNDIKPDNFVLDVSADENGNEVFTPILIDFGGATFDGEVAFGILSIQYLPPEFLDQNLLTEAEMREAQQEEIFNQLLVIDTAFDDFISAADDLSSLVEQNGDVQRLKKELAEDCKPERKREIFRELEAIKLEILIENRGEIDIVNRVRGKVALLEQMGQIKARLEELEEEIPRSVDVSNGIPYKNDDFALGMVLAKLYDWDSPKEIQSIIEALVHDDPEKRMTAREALAKLAE